MKRSLWTLCQKMLIGGIKVVPLILIRLYQLFISPLKTPCCRFRPTCSEYAREAFLLHGPIKGAILSAKRILRCHPWGGWGYDPVPKPIPHKKKRNILKINK